MKSADALDRVWKPFGKEQKREFAKMKAEEELSKELQDPMKIRKTASLFEREVARQRRAAGL